MRKLLQQRLSRLPISTKTTDELAELREQCTTSFGAFVRAAWHTVEQQPLIWGWHHDAIVEHLEAITRGDLRYLLINVPPASSKTSLVQVFWPMWEWVTDQHQRVPGFDTASRPDMKYIFATYAMEVARADALKCRKVGDSFWYQKLFGERWQKNEDQWGSAIFSNEQGGFRRATSIDGQATGKHANRKVLDDPNKAQDVASGRRMASPIELQNAWAFWTQTMTSRNVDAYTAEIIIMQRLHELDVAGRVIKRGGFEELRIPMEFERRARCSTVVKRGDDGSVAKSWTDPRTEDGELMCPERFPASEVEKFKRDLGPEGYAAQYQQRPAPAGGGIFREDHFKYWTQFPHGGTWIISVDCSFKNADTSDYVVAQVWCALGADFFKVDQIRDRLDVLQTCNAIIQLKGEYKHVGDVLIEDAANGPAVATIIKKAVPAVKLVKPIGGKIARANAAARFYASGNVYYPDPKRFPWVQDSVAEHTSFPYGANDDDVDAGSQAVNHLAVAQADFAKMTETMRKMGLAG